MEHTFSGVLARIWKDKLAVLFYLGLSGLGFSQSVATATASDTPDSSLLLTFEQGQQALAGQMSQLVGQGATPAQLTLWMNQNQAAFQAQQNLAVQLGALNAAQPLPYISNVVIPDDASPTLEDFLVNRATLANAQAQIHNQLLQQGTFSPATEANLFQQQNAAALQAQAQRAQVLAAESEAEPQPVPPPLSVPANASPALQAFLTLRDQLLRAQVQLHNQNLTLTPADRQAALTQWQQQNAASLQQLQQLAQNLTSSN